jgi:excisionase family DNA binding protein
LAGSTRTSSLTVGLFYDMVSSGWISSYATQRNGAMDVYCLNTHESKTVERFPEGLTLLREKAAASRQRRLTLEERITRLEIGSLYKRSTENLIQLYQGDRQIPELVSAIGALVDVMASQQQVSSIKETLSTKEAAKKLDCSPASVRELAKSGKLPFIPQGKNFKFRQVDIDAYQDSERRSGADVRKNGRKRLSVRNVRRSAEAETKEEKKSESEEVFPSREEIKKLWRS